MDDLSNMTVEEYRSLTEYSTEESQIDCGSSSKRALIYGLIAVALTTTVVGGLPFGIVAIVHGIKAVKTRPQDKRGMVGIILGITAILLFFLMICWLIIQFLVFLFMP